MIRAVADTHTVLWYLFADPHISPIARTTGMTAAGDGDQIALSVISLAEMIYLIDKGRIDSTALDRVLAALDRPNPVFVEIPVDRAVARAMRYVNRAQVPDLPDRVIVATAVQLGVPLISRDSKIRASGVTTIW